MSRFGLRLRLVVAFVALTVAASVLVAVTSVVLTRQALVDGVIAQAVAGTQADLVTAGLTVRSSSRVEVDGEGRRWRVLDAVQLEQLVSGLVLPRDTSVLILQRHGPDHYSIPGGSLPMPIPDALLRRVRDGLVAYLVTQTPTGDPRLLVGGRVALDALELYREVDLTPIEQDVALMARRAAWAAAIPVVLSLLVGMVAAAGVLRPVRHARNAARRIAAGNLDVRVPVSGDDELAELAADLNTMAASLRETITRLHTSMAQQRQFVADVAHELRTPLTALTAAVDVLDQADNGAAGTAEADGTTGAAGAMGADATDRREALRLVVDEVRGLRTLVEDLMEMSRLDAGVSRLDAHEVGLRTVVDGALRRRGFDGGVEVDVPTDLRVVVDPRRLDAVVGNLVGNAIVHGAPPVRLTARRTPAGLEIDVRDAGPGVPEALRTRVFDRFVKADSARQRTGGSGLGLAIARENARLHGGDVTLVATDDEDTGAVFRCLLPAGRVVTPPAAPPPPSSSPEPVDGTARAVDDQQPATSDRKVSR